MAEVHSDRPFITLICSDNLPDLNGGRFPASEVVKMPESILGKSATFDHDWWDVRQMYGRIVAASAYEAEPPENLTESDRAIIEKEGYWVCKIDIEVQRAEQTLPMMSENSIGFSYGRIRCPECECPEQDIRSPKCPNYFWDLEYYERHELEAVHEDSFVLIPANPRAVRVQ